MRRYVLLGIAALCLSSPTNAEEPASGVRQITFPIAPNETGRYEKYYRNYPLSIQRANVDGRPTLIRKSYLSATIGGTYGINFHTKEPVMACIMIDGLVALSPTKRPGPRTLHEVTTADAWFSKTEQSCLIFKGDNNFTLRGWPVAATNQRRDNKSTNEVERFVFTPVGNSNAVVLDGELAAFNAGAIVIALFPERPVQPIAPSGTVTTRSAAPAGTGSGERVKQVLKPGEFDNAPYASEVRVIYTRSNDVLKSVGFK